MKNNPRQPTPEEREQLSKWLATRGLFSNDLLENLNEARWLVEHAYIAVFDDYVTGGPGFAGKVMSVIWDGGPSQHEVYTWDKDNALRCVVSGLA